MTVEPAPHLAEGRRADLAVAEGAATAGPEHEEFDRLRRRLQLTNLRIARLYTLLKAQKDEAPEEESQDVLDELYISDAEFQQHLGALIGEQSTGLSDADGAQSLAALDRAIAVLRRRIQAEELSARRKGTQTRFERLCSRCGLSYESFGEGTADHKVGLARTVGDNDLHQMRPLSGGLHMLGLAPIYIDFRTLRRREDCSLLPVRIDHGRRLRGLEHGSNRRTAGELLDTPLEIRVELERRPKESAGLIGASTDGVVHSDEPIGTREGRHRRYNIGTGQARRELRPGGR